MSTGIPLGVFTAARDDVIAGQARYSWVWLRLPPAAQPLALSVRAVKRGARDDAGLRVQSSRSYARLVVRESFKASLCPALIESLSIFDRARLDRPVRDGELGAIKLRVPGVDPDSVLQVGQVCRGGLPLGDCRAQGVQECTLLNRVLVSVLRQQPRRLGRLFADERPSGPSPPGDLVSKPAGVVGIDALPLLAEAVREPTSVRISLRGS